MSNVHPVMQATIEAWSSQMKEVCANAQADAHNQAAIRHEASASSRTATLDAWNPTKSGPSAETVRLMVSALQEAHAFIQILPESEFQEEYTRTIVKIEQALDAAGAPYQAGE